MYYVGTILEALNYYKVNVTQKYTNMGGSKKSCLMGIIFNGHVRKKYVYI